MVVHTGDILTEPPVAALLERVGDGLCLAVLRRAVGAGPVGLGDDGRVVRLRGQSFGSEISGAEYIGVCALGDRCLATLPDEGCLIADWALPELRQGRAIATLSVESGFQDVGDLGAYLAANLSWLRGRASWVGSGATVAASVQLHQSIVGEGAQVSGRGALEQCVIWPGAHVEAPLARSVVTELGEIVPVP